MALKQLIIGQKLTDLRAALAALKPEYDTLSVRRSAWKEREAKATKAFSEITKDTPEKERAAFQREADEIDSEDTAIAEAETALMARKKEIEDQISALTEELNEINKKLDPPAQQNTPDPEPEDTNNRKDSKTMVYSRRNRIIELTKRDEVKDFIKRFRELRAVKDTSLTVPESMLEMLREDISRYSKLYKHVKVAQLRGEAKQTIAGGIPEAVWTETLGAVNEMNISFNQLTVSGAKVAGFIPVPNSYLNDSDVNLASEIIDKIGQAIGLAVDRAILYGTGTDMPVGIVTRLALTSKPAWWDVKAPAFEDIHITHIGSLSSSSVKGAALFKEMVAVLGHAKHKYTGAGHKFWVMNEATWLKMKIELLTINAAGAVVTGADQEMPIVGGAVETLEIIPDNVIIGGYGDQYLLVEREGTSIAESSHVRFVEDETVYRGTARYDGKPIAGEGFAMFTLATASGETSSEFEPDYANTDLGALVVSSTVSATVSGKSKITVTGAESSGTKLGYKLGGIVSDVKCGEGNDGFTDITSGAEITAATGKIITVVEFDISGRAVKIGSTTITAK